MKLCKPKLPRGLTIISDGVDLSFKRAYVTKAQEAKRKDMIWKDFEDAEDYSGLLNAIRNSKTTKMTLVFRAFIIVPKEDFEAEIEPALASQRVVCYSLIGVDNRLLLLSKRPLWHPLLALLIPSNSKLSRINGDVQLTLASSATNDTMKFRPPSMSSWIPQLCLIGLQLLSIKHALSTSTLLLVDQNGTRFSIPVVVKAAVWTHHRTTINLQYMSTCPITLHVVLHISAVSILLQALLTPRLIVDDPYLSRHHLSYLNTTHGFHLMEMG